MSGENPWFIDPDVYSTFEVWFAEQVKSDPIFQGTTTQQAIEWSRSRGVGYMDEVLALPGSGQTWQDYFHINHVPNIGSLQPEGGRVGGDHDRGFSPALNQVMRESAKIISAGSEEPKPSEQQKSRNAIRPPLKRAD